MDDTTLAAAPDVLSRDALMASIAAVETHLAADAGVGPFDAAETARLLGLRIADLALLTIANRIGHHRQRGIELYTVTDIARYAAAPLKSDQRPQPSDEAKGLHLDELSRWLTHNHSNSGRLKVIAWNEQVRVDLSECRAGLLGLLVWGNDEETYQAGAALRAFGIVAHRTDDEQGWEIRPESPGPIGGPTPA